MRPKSALELVLVLLLAWHISAALFIRDSSTASLISNILQLIVAICAAGASAYAAMRSRAPLRWFWWCVAVALLQWSFGQANFVYFENMHHRPVPTATATGPLMALFVAPLWLGLILLRRRESDRFDLGVALDIVQIAIVAAAAYVRLFYVPQLWPYQYQPSLLGYIYDVRNITLLASLGFLYFDFRFDPFRTTLRYFLIAFTIYSVGEIYYFHFTPRGVITSGRLLDLTWTLPFAMVTFAALRSPTYVECSRVGSQRDCGSNRVLPLMLPMFASFLALNLYQYLPLWASLFLFLTIGTYGARLWWEGYIREAVEKQWHDEERKTADSVSLLEATLESTADGILVVDREKRVVLYNQRFADIWEIPPSVLERRDDKELLASVLSKLRDADAFLARVKELYADPSAESFDTVELKDNRSFERLSRPHVMEGKIVGRVWSFRDVTQSRRLEDQLRQAQKMEAVGTLAGGIAHDFNNLLTVIIGYTQLAQMRAPENVSLKNDLEQITRSAEQAAALIRQLLGFSRKQIVRPTVMDLNGSVERSLKLLERIIGEDIRMETQLDPDLPSIEADPSLMEQVLMNLAVNARDAMPKGGILSFQTRKSGEHVELLVSDTGSGIDEKVMPHIFEPFFTTKEMGRGTGLGLAMVYAAVQQSHGTIRVESALNEGTTFIITLPVSEGKAEKASIKTPQGRQGSGTILLVEDEPALRELCASVLGMRGYKVVECSDPKAALELVDDGRGRKLDMILTDMIMPGLSGDELVRRVRLKVPGIKVLFISGYDKPSTLSAREVAPLLMKPFTPAELVSKVEQVLHQPLAVI